MPATACALMKRISWVRIPQEILTNEGKNLMSKILRGICSILKIKQLRMSLYHPQMDGLVECFKRTLKEMIRACIQGNPRGWDAMISPLLSSIREVPQASKGYAPFKLVYGHSPCGLLDLICEGWEAGMEDVAWPQAVVDFCERLRKAQAIGQEKLG